MITKTMTALALAAIPWLLPAQDGAHYYLGPAGGRLEGKMMRIDWALGEAAIATHSLPAGFLTEGFLQPGPFATSPTTVVPSFPEGAIRVTPNPGRDYFELMMDFTAQQAGLECRDIKGRLLTRRDLVADGPSTLRLEATPWAAGTYLLTVWSRSPDRQQTIQLIKSN